MPGSIVEKIKKKKKLQSEVERSLADIEEMSVATPLLVNNKYLCLEEKTLKCCFRVVRARSGYLI